MAILTFPYSIEQFADILKIESVKWGIKRYDELSSLGSGQTIAAELSPPLWTGEVNLREATKSEAKRIAAKIRALQGAINSLLIYDPESKYPQDDPDGTLFGSSTPTVSSVHSTRRGISIQGLPAGYTSRAGDKLQITYTQSGTRYAFLEVSSDAAASSSGVMSDVAVFPHVPVGVAANATVTLIKPACKCFIVPDSHNEGTLSASTQTVSGQSFQVMQRR
jgi:hypothetical protein